MESSRRGLQLCFRPHCNRRSAKEVIRPQSPGSPGCRDFGTPTRESRERNAVWMQAPWRGTEYTTRGKVLASQRGKVVTSPSPRGKVLASPRGGGVGFPKGVRWWLTPESGPWQVPTPKGVPNAKLTSCGWFLGCKGGRCWLPQVRAVVSQVSSRLPVALPSTKGASTMH